MPVFDPGRYPDEMIRAMRDTLDERKRQDKLWGERRGHDPFVWTAILMEEVGEFCEDALKARFDPSGHVREHRVRHIRTEAVQIAAVALCIIECIDSGAWDGLPSQEERQEP